MLHPSKVFTITARYGEPKDELTLLFGLIPGKNDPTHMTPAQTVNCIAQDPLIRKLLGPYGLVGSVMIDGYFRIIATNDIRRWAVPLITGYDISLSDRIYILRPDEVEEYSVRKVYNECTQPQQLIVGCEGCLEIGTHPEDCPIKTEAIRAEERSIGDFTPATAFTTLRNRKTIIAGYTYISPTLTKCEPFCKTYRDIGEHDFSAIEEASRIRSRAIHERTRKKKFKAEVCPTCPMHPYCDKYKECTGPFKSTEKEMAEECRRKFPQEDEKFTTKQLLELLYNSGELKHRPNGIRYWATLYKQHCLQPIQFVLNSITGNANSIVFTGKEFNRCKEYMKKHASWKDLPEGVDPLTRMERSLLYELLSIRYSPTSIGRWHKTQYDTIGISFSPHAHFYGRLQLHFVTNHYRHWAIDWYICPWTIRPKSYGDLCYDDVTILHPTQSVSPLSEIQYHSNR